jgi:hypothetical protein
MPASYVKFRSDGVFLNRNPCKWHQEWTNMDWTSCELRNAIPANQCPRCWPTFVGVAALKMHVPHCTAPPFASPFAAIVFC